MELIRSPKRKLAVVFLLLVSFACAPIWGVKYFINQDGSGHVYSAWMMTEMLRGNARFNDLFQFNFIFYPDVSGHWLLVLMLFFVSAFTATKVMMTLTYVGLVAAVGWLRQRTVGRDGILTSFLIGGALAFNWLWLGGFYNFNLGFALAVFTIGCYFRWREEMNFGRAAALAILFFLIFVSHMVSFAIAAGTVAFLCVLPFADLSKRRCIWTAAAFLPVIPIAVFYVLSTEGSGSFVPVWVRLSGHYGLTNWLTQLRGVDSFIITSRHTFPFVDSDSILFAIFTPFVWILIAFALLLAPTGLNRIRESRLWSSKYLPFILLAAASIFVSIVSPDNFEFSGSTPGVLRERLFLIGLIYLVPLYRSDAARPLFRTLAKAALTFVILFQTLALWDYAVRASRSASEFLSARDHVQDGTSLAAITIVSNGMRFSANPLAQMDNYIGVGREVLICDDYEFAHYLFPIVAKQRDDHEFVRAFTSSNGYLLNDPETYSEERINRLAEVLATDNQRIDTLLVWGSDPQIEAAFKPWFGPDPFFVNGQVRLYRHK